MHQAKMLAVADTLSRDSEQRYGDGASHNDVAAHIDTVVCQVPATPQKVKEIQHSTGNDL